MEKLQCIPVLPWPSPEGRNTKVLEEQGVFLPDIMRTARRLLSCGGAHLPNKS